MKVCLINPADSPRTEIFDLASHLSLLGHEVTVIYPTRNKILNSKVKTVSFPAYFLPKIHYTIPNLIKEYSIISNLVSKENYDIIQACDYDYLTSIPPLFVKLTKKVPIIITTDAFPGISWFFGNPFVDFIGKLYTYTLGKLLFKLCDKFIVLSTNLAEDSKKIGTSPDKVSIIPNGIDFNQFSPNIEGTEIKNKLNINNNEKIILFIGRLSLVKRVDILISISKRFSNEPIKTKTIIVGEGEYSDYYRKLAESADNIIFTGYVPHSEIHKYCAIADVFVLPSLSEGLPNVLMEVAACAKPVVATNTGGISDIVIHGKTGFLVEPYDVDSFFNYVKLLLYNEELSIKLGRNGCEYVNKKFNWNCIVNKYVSIYKSLLNNNCNSQIF